MMANFRGKDREGYRLKYQYELICTLLSKKKPAVRKAMQRMGLNNSVFDFVKYAEKVLKKRKK